MWDMSESLDAPHGVLTCSSSGRGCCTRGSSKHRQLSYLPSGIRVINPCPHDQPGRITSWHMLGITGYCSGGTHSQGIRQLTFTRIGAPSHVMASSAAHWFDTPVVHILFPTWTFSHGHEYMPVLRAPIVVDPTKKAVTPIELPVLAPVGAQMRVNDVSGEC